MPRKNKKKSPRRKKSRRKSLTLQKILTCANPKCPKRFRQKNREIYCCAACEIQDIIPILSSHNPTQMMDIEAESQNDVSQPTQIQLTHSQQTQSQSFSIPETNSISTQTGSNKGRKRIEREELIQRIKNDEQKLRRNKIEIERLKEKAKNAVEELNEFENSHFFAEIVKSKEGKYYSFELARHVMKLRLSSHISLRKVEEVARAALECFIRDCSEFKSFKFPSKTTISRIEKAMGKLSKLSENEILKQQKHICVFFDSSEQFKYVEFMAVSASIFHNNQLQMKLLEMKEQNSHKAAGEAEILAEVIEDSEINWDQVFFLCGDSANTNIGVKGGVVRLIADQENEIIPYIRCLMHILNFCFTEAADNWFSGDVLGEISFVVKKVNNDRYKNQKLLEDLKQTEGISLSGTPEPTRIGSYCAASRIIVLYLEEILELIDDYLNDIKSEGLEWKKCKRILEKNDFFFNCNFIYDFYVVAFLPMLKYFETANTIEEKSNLKDKLCEFYQKLQRMREEIENGWEEENCIMKNCQKNCISMNGDEHDEAVYSWVNLLDHFEKKFKENVISWDRFPFVCLDLFSKNIIHKQKAASVILKYFEEPKSLLYKFNNIFDDRAMEILNCIISNPSFDFSTTDLFSELTKIFRIMPFTNCYSERVFSIQKYIHSMKRNIKPKTLANYLFLYMNKTKIPDEFEELYYNEMKNVLKEEKKHANGEETEDKSGREIFWESFGFEDLKRGEDEFSETLRYLLGEDV